MEPVQKAGDPHNPHVKQADDRFVMIGEIMLVLLSGKRTVFFK
jgi:hypothetical protein